MKQTDIKQGGFYTDQKSGLREVLEAGSHIQTLGMDEAAIGVRYRVLAASKQTDVLTESQMELKSFASWAKAALTEIEANAFIFSQMAGRTMVRLTDAQREFIRSIDIDCTLTSLVECNRSELRVAKSCHRKGLVKNEPKLESGADSFDIELTQLGLAVLSAVHEEHVDG